MEGGCLPVGPDVQREPQGLLRSATLAAALTLSIRTVRRASCVYTIAAVVDMQEEIITFDSLCNVENAN